MLKKTITFEDLDGNKVTEEFHFNISKAEVAEMELSQKGGLTEYLKKIVAEEDGAKLVQMFKELIQMSVGKRSEDGRRFIKTQEIRDEFMQTNAYSELFMELATQAEAAAAFVTAIVPQDMAEQVRKGVETQTTETVKDTTGSTSGKDYDALLADPNWEPTPVDLREMSPAQMQKAYLRKTHGTS